LPWLQPARIASDVARSAAQSRLKSIARPLFINNLRESGTLFPAYVSTGDRAYQKPRAATF
jgi:hypothetical protein